MLAPQHQQAVEFTVPAIPIAQPRQRTAVRNGIAMNYTPAKHPVTDYKATVRLAASAVYSGEPLTCPVGMWITFVLPRPANMVWKSKGMPRVWHTKKPDKDNLEKSTLDALTGLLFRDDSQVCWTNTQKIIASGSEQPHVKIVVKQLFELDGRS